MARGSRGAKHRVFGGNLEQAKEKRTTWELKEIYCSSAQAIMEEPSDIWLQKKAK